MLTAADTAAAFSFIDPRRRWTRTRDRAPFKVSTMFSSCAACACAYVTRRGAFSSVSHVLCSTDVQVVICCAGAVHITLLIGAVEILLYTCPVCLIFDLLLYRSVDVLLSAVNLENCCGWPVFAV